jgi:hypothetical protein
MCVIAAQPGAEFGSSGGWSESDHNTVRAIVWGLLAVCLAEWTTLGAVRNIAIAEKRRASSFGFAIHPRRGRISVV